MESITDKVILLTGGTGSFGQKFTETVLKRNPKSLRIYSRGELLQKNMSERFDDSRLRFFIGDVRDKDRLSRAMNQADIVVHAAALKQVPICEYNPADAIKTNVNGSMNVIDCAIDNKVKKVIAVSSDKAVHPTNLYGITKACMEKMITQANVYGTDTRLSCVRYGNVIGSRGSVIPIFKEQAETGCITITDNRMTRFWLTLDQGVSFVLNCLDMMRGGEIFVPKIPSMRISDLADMFRCERKVTGIRPGEKLHEILVTEDEARHTRMFEDCFVIQPEFPFWTEDTYWDLTGESMPDGFRYTSDSNTQWLPKEELARMMDE